MFTADSRSKRHRFWKSVHQVEILRRGARCAFDEIVETTDRDHATTDEPGCDIAEVRTRRVFGSWQVIDDANKRLLGIEVANHIQQLLLRHIAGNLRAEADALARIASRERFYRQWDDFEGSPLRLGIMAWRGRPMSGTLTTGLDLRFSGTFPNDGAKLREMLATTVDEKIQKAYDTYERGLLWLLAYARFYPVIDHEAVSLARAMLHSKSHPFEAVWVFFPFAGDQPGVVAKVFP